MQDMNRRETLTVAAGLGAGVLTGGLFAGRAHATPRRPELGWDEAAGKYTLPALSYAYADLEPHIDAQTMEIHHSKHHAGYVRGLNNALAQLRDLRAQQSDPGTIAHWTKQVSFHASGHVNHAMFWTGMAPAGKGGGGQPSGPLAAAIQRDFGSYDAFAWNFKQASAKVEGSGWGWLVYEPVAGRLLVIQGESQQKLIITGTVPLLGVDVWEHAYYLRYQNRRAAYLDAFMNVVNWPEIQRRYQSATSQ